MEYLKYINPMPNVMDSPHSGCINRHGKQLVRVLDALPLLTSCLLSCPTTLSLSASFYYFFTLKHLAFHLIYINFAKSIVLSSGDCPIRASGYPSFRSCVV